MAASTEVALQLAQSSSACSTCLYTV